MGLFNRSKKVKSNDTKDSNSFQANEQRYNSLGEPLDKLVNDDLPWGWIYANRDFTNPADPNVLRKIPSPALPRRVLLCRTPFLLPPQAS